MVENIFTRTPLEQTTGVIAQRWGQDGSTPINDSTTRSTNGTFYTVTAGKVLYVSTITFSNNAASAELFYLKDGEHLCRACYNCSKTHFLMRCKSCNSIGEIKKTEDNQKRVAKYVAIYRAGALDDIVASTILAGIIQTNCSITVTDYCPNCASE